MSVTENDVINNAQSIADVINSGANRKALPDLPLLASADDPDDLLLIRDISTNTDKGIKKSAIVAQAGFVFQNFSPSMIAIQSTAVQWPTQPSISQAEYAVLGELVLIQFSMSGANEWTNASSGTNRYIEISLPALSYSQSHGSFVGTADVNNRANTNDGSFLAQVKFASSGGIRLYIKFDNPNFWASGAFPLGSGGGTERFYNTGLDLDLSFQVYLRITL